MFVVVDWDVLSNGHQPGQESAYIAGLGNVPVSVARDLIDDDAFLVGVVRHGTEILKVKRWGRHIPVEVRDALMVKYRFRCSTPGCTNWVRLEMDHIIPYAKGGETSYTNLRPTCHLCHTDKTAEDRLFWDDG